MKGFFKRVGRRIVKRVATEVLNFVERDAVRQVPATLKTQQLLLADRYRALARAGGPLPSFAEVGFRAYSQCDEDGILLYLFSLLSSPTRRAVEICAGDGIECNAANLLIHHGWGGLLVDGSEENIQRGREFYRLHPDTWIWPPTLARAWVTREGVNALVREHGFAGEIDLLSIDLDGIDYWVWEALDCVTPRVVVVEYNDILGPSEAVTIPYRADFRASYEHGPPDYCGASLPAFVKLGRRKGYRLVGVNRYGFNAFFVREGLGEPYFPEVPAEACFTHPKVQAGLKDRQARVTDREWVRV